MIRLVLTTFPDVEQARKVAHQLINAELAACVTFLPAALSVYIWKGKPEETEECLLLLKTTAERFKDLYTELLKIHPYEVPEVISFDADFCHPDYAKWVKEQCGKST